MLRSSVRIASPKPLVLRRYGSNSSIPFSTKMAALIAKTKPEQIYLYKPTALLKFGSWSLSVVFLIYGLTFADWSISSSRELYAREDSEKKDEETGFWNNPTFLFASRISGSVVLSLIPLTLSAAALYLPSRVVASIKYIPHGSCQLTRRAIISGKPISCKALISDVVRNQKTRVYTGKGFQGVQDNASFVFFLTNKTRPLWDRFYIVNRSGSFWGQDGRIFDALFGKDSIKSLERQDFDTNSIETNKESSSLLNMIEDEERKTKLSGNATSAKDIILKNQRK